MQDGVNPMGHYVKASCMLTANDTIDPYSEFIQSIPNRIYFEKTAKERKVYYA